ncbi:hypothetical protein WA026_001852 [Henosepilachna vigintioctopunctata]|uniref:Uncharacterized protein n=1 Tax=Henosepilachna vigintioctopunctata TaxID=420089 RepID=A0AAW1UV12_9CUCU
MHVGIPVNTADYQSNVPVNRLTNNELKTSCGPPNQNGLRPCYDNESNHESSSVHARNTSPRANQFNKSSSLGNLSFINIVGLPYHPRQSSVPSTTTLRNQVGSDSTIFPNHFRYASESNAVPPRPPRTSVPSNFNNATVEGDSQVKGAPPTPAKGHVPPELRWNKSGGTAIDRVNSAVTLTYQFNNLGFPYTTISNQQSSGSLITPSRATTCSEPCRIQSNDIPINQIDNQENVSNVNVNFHRTVPTNARMNVISAVPTIKCLNTHSAKNVSNVQIMPLSGTNSDQNASSSSSPCKTSITSSQVTVHNEQTPTQLISPSTTETVSSVYLSNRAVPQRTFTSTEAQTDDTDLAALELISDRERRRRERRERRVHRRANPVSARPTGEISTQTNNGDNSGNLPDILGSHLPPPYTSHPNTLQRNQNIPNIHTVPGRTMPPHMSMIPPAPPQILNGIVPPPGFAPGMVPHPRPRGAIQTIVPNNVPHVSFPPPSAIPGQVPLVQNVPDPNSGYRFALPVGQFRR